MIFEYFVFSTVYIGSILTDPVLTSPPVCLPSTVKWNGLVPSGNDTYKNLTKSMLYFSKITLAKDLKEDVQKAMIMTGTGFNN